MITKDTLPKLLASLGFSSSGKTFRKTFGDAEIVVDFIEKLIIYPKAIKIHDTTTCNFSANENFVVLECVCRLLEKGYKPEHIELEPRWNLGHGAKGGKADILVRDNEKKNLLLIECKTAGNEFTKAWRNTLQDGAQLFSYTQQISDTQFLCLYTSDFDGSKITYTSHVIAHRDNDDFLNDNKKLKGFKAAQNAKARFAVWRDTYKLDYTTQGIFEPSILPYHIGKDKYALADLRGISDEDRQKKYNEFATILRQHNVSGRENALDKLVNLFLCKIVDEIENPLDLKFYWKGVAYDTHFELFDRLQQLYQSGMSKFLGEAITYINRNDVFNAMRFIRKNPDATQRAVWELFVRQKFYTNNDFSFIDVHNERLFYQNAEVLLKILQMWQGIRLTSDTHHNQFLGDMFEDFLDQGVKQSEGQYFTPVPFCRFIITSLPLPKKIKECGAPPKMIDYACGAGHFLNEYAMQIESLLDKQANIDEYHKAIIGIEKEYRLSKIAKVSAFMYGQQGINVCYGDALIQRHAAFSQIQNESFDILAANPPYSVSGFLETLPEEERAAYRLADTIDKLDTANSIEAFFIERAKQLLKAGGIAALILPSSILSNSGGTYVKTREIILQYFDIVAIAEFVSGTFGKTGTTTVTLFMRRKATTPDPVEHYRERIAAWFGDDDGQNSYQDAHLLDQYALHIGIAAADYRSLLIAQPNEALLAHEIFLAYQAVFEKNTEIRNLKRSNSFRNKSPDEQAEELRIRFLKFVRDIEQDKLLHYFLATQQANPVLIIRSPEKGDAMKQFLGYDWSERKGNEGINIFKDASGKHNTPLYDPSDRNNPDKIAYYIARNFDGKLGVIPEALQQYVTTARLVDMLDFSRVTFEKQISLTARSRVEVKSKWPLAKLSDLVEIISGGTPDTANHSYWDGDIPWLSVADFSSRDRYVYSAAKQITQEGLDNSSTKLLRVGDLIISARGTVGALAQLGVPMAFNQSCYGLRSKSQPSNDYIFYTLKNEIQQLKSQAFGSKFDAITMKTFEDVKLPVPPEEIQRQIVTECEMVDEAVEKVKEHRADAEERITKLIQDLFAKGPHDKVGNILSLEYGKSLSKETRRAGLYPVMGSNGRDGFHNEHLIEGPCVIVGRKGSAGKVVYEEQPCWPIDTTFYVKLKKPYNLKLLHYVLRELNIERMIKGIGVPGVNRNDVYQLTIPWPSEVAQKTLYTQIEATERAIAEEQAVIAAAPAKKQAIMQRYL